jgi:hypothetical protein
LRLVHARLANVDAQFLAARAVGILERGALCGCEFGSAVERVEIPFVVGADADIGAIVEAIVGWPVLDVVGERDASEHAEHEPGEGNRSMHRFPQIVALSRTRLDSASAASLLLRRDRVN